MPEAPITHRGYVTPAECDHMGHLNVAHFVKKFDQSTWNMFADLGLNRQYLEDAGIVLAAVEQTFTYKRELMPGDVVTIRTEVLELAGKKIRFRHEMVESVSGESAAVAMNLALCVDAKTRKTRPFPDEVIAGARARLPEAAE